jgi:hypothetical protein
MDRRTILHRAAWASFRPVKAEQQKHGGFRCAKV